MFHSNPLLFQRVALFAAVSFTSASLLAREHQDSVRGDVDLKTGISLPKRVGSFERQSEIKYDDGGYPMATYMAGALAMADVFYYKNLPFATEYAGARDAVIRNNPAARMISDGPSNLHPSGRRAVFTFVYESSNDLSTKWMSELLMFPHRGYYLTFRIEYPAAHADRARQEVDTFVRGFRLP